MWVLDNCKSTSILVEVSRIESKLCKTKLQAN